MQARADNPTAFIFEHLIESILNVFGQAGQLQGVFFLFVEAEFLVWSEVMFGLGGTTTIFLIFQGDVTVFVPQPRRRERPCFPPHVLLFTLKGPSCSLEHVDCNSKDKHEAARKQPRLDGWGCWPVSIFLKLRNGEVVFTLSSIKVWKKKSALTRYYTLNTFYFHSFSYLEITVYQIKKNDKFMLLFWYHNINLEMFSFSGVFTEVFGAFYGCNGVSRTRVVLWFILRCCCGFLVSFFYPILFG